MAGESGVTIRLSPRAMFVGVIAVVVAGAAIVSALSITGRPARQHIILSSGSSTTLPASAPPSQATGSSVAGEAQAALTGRVTDAAGNPVADAYVIGLDSLTVVRTDSSGQFSMPCELSTNGVEGLRSEPLVAASWLLPVLARGQGSYAVGQNTTDYGPAPSTPGLGYVFSGGATSVADASTVRCDGHPHDFALPPGGSVDIQVLDHSGNPVSDSVGPPDNLYLPGLGTYAALETSPLSADGHQLLSQLGAGDLRIDGTNSTLDCSGPGVVPDAAVAGADVTIVSGQTIHVVCHET